VHTYTRWDYGCGTEGCAVEYTWNYAGANATVGWTAGATTCGSCHGAPPPGGWHQFHGNLPSQRECQTCHPSAASTLGADLRITDPALHVNGVVDLAPRFTSGCNCH
jgi:hypothetical protein